MSNHIELTQTVDILYQLPGRPQSCYTKPGLRIAVYFLQHLFYPVSDAMPEYYRTKAFHLTIKAKQQMVWVENA
jgi:hypothetical protein